MSLVEIENIDLTTRETVVVVVVVTDTRLLNIR